MGILSEENKRRNLSDARISLNPFEEIRHRSLTTYSKESRSIAACVKIIPASISRYEFELKYQYKTSSNASCQFSIFHFSMKSGKRLTRDSLSLGSNQDCGSFHGSLGEDHNSHTFSLELLKPTAQIGLHQVPFAKEIKNNIAFKQSRACLPVNGLLFVCLIIPICVM